VLKRARKAAVDRDASLSDLFRAYLAELVERDEARRSFLATELDSLFEESAASSKGRKVGRDSLHER
jgi:hypothetical protein